MVKVIAEFFIQKESLETAIESIPVAVAETRKEDGNITYEVFQDEADETHLIFIETWESKEVLSAHMETPHFKALIAAITPIQTKEPVIHIGTKLA